MLYLVPLLALIFFLIRRNSWPQPWKDSNSDFDETFLKQVVTDNFWGGDAEIRIILSKMLSCFRKKRSECHGVLVSHAASRFQMLQFDPDASPVLFKGVPMIPLAKWGICTKRESALNFLGSNSSDEKIESISVSTGDIFRALFEHLAATCSSSGEKDLKTGVRIYSGYLSPKKV